jgi:RNA-directed DNA polymerase
MSELATATSAWHQRPWRTREGAVWKRERRLDQAWQAGDIRRVHSLQTRLLQSRAATRLAVRRVTQDNHGKHTAGRDGIQALTPHQRDAWAAPLGTLPTGRPTSRGWMPQPGQDAQRPLALPTRHDRARQARVKRVLEPAWDARCAPNSDGCRPGRSGHDAIGAICSALEKHPTDALDAESAQCVARIDPRARLRKSKTVPPLNRLVKAGLQAGGLDHGVCTDTTTGTPQGGGASPLLANSARHGLDECIRAHCPARTRRNPAQPGRQLHGQPQLIRYADDLVILHRDRTVSEQCRHLTHAWLQDIGLELSEQQTRLAHTLEKREGEAGCNCLGFQGRP